MTYKATIEYGVCGIHKENVVVLGESIAAMADIINTKTMQVADEIMEAEEQDGDLRQFSPCYANGYMTTCGMEPILNDGDDLLSGCIIDLTVDGVECKYHMKGHNALRQATGLG